MNVLIVGGLGYIGTALQETYRDEEVSLVVTDREFKPRLVAEMAPGSRFFEADMGDLETMRPLMQWADVVYLLAAEIQAESSIDRAPSVWEANYQKITGLMACARPDTVLFFPSTATVFAGTQDPQRQYTSEDYPVPRYPYAEAKVAVEQWLRGGDQDFVIGRFATCFGWSPGMRFNLVVNIFTKLALEGKPLTVHGRGMNLRPFVHVQDVARAIRFAVDHRTEMHNRTFHAARYNLNIGELAEILIAEMGGSMVTTDDPVAFPGYQLADSLAPLGFEYEWTLEAACRDLNQRLEALGAMPAATLTLI